MCWPRSSHSSPTKTCITYNQFTNPDGTTISVNGKEIEAKAFMELLNPAEGTEALAKYGKPWGVAILER